MRRARHPGQGFTLVELVMVLLLAGILAVFVLPNFNSTALPERGFRDAVWTAVAHARRVAVSSRRFTCVAVTAGTGNAGSVALTRDPSDPDSLLSVNCNQPLALPAPDSSCAASNQACAPRGVTLGGTNSMVFDPLGRLVSSSSPKVVAASVATITVSNQPAITIQPDTGYVQ